MKRQAIYVDKKKFKNILHYLRDSASSVQVNILTHIILFETWLKYNKSMFFYNVL